MGLSDHRNMNSCFWTSLVLVLTLPVDVPHQACPFIVLKGRILCFMVFVIGGAHLMQVIRRRRWGRVFTETSSATHSQDLNRTVSF